MEYKTIQQMLDEDLRSINTDVQMGNLIRHWMKIIMASDDRMVSIGVRRIARDEYWQFIMPNEAWFGEDLSKSLSKAGHYTRTDKVEKLRLFRRDIEFMLNEYCKSKIA